LTQLYRDLTRAIRTIDPDHLIVYEGAHWATNWDVFTEVWDDNSLLQFHKYWSSPDVATIEKFLETRDRLGLPIYMGEGGENTLEWIYAAHRLYETHDIGWNFWPWKKIDTITSPASIDEPPGWEHIVAAIDDPFAISPEAAQRVFDEFLTAMRIENCRWQPEVVAALLAEHPKVIPAWGFGYRGFGESYSSRTATTIPGIREDDSVTLRWAWPDDNPANPFEQTDGRPYHSNEQLVVELEVGDWLEFELSGATSARVYDAAGVDAPVSVDVTSRGLRVTALRATPVHRIEPAW
jgi:hypothetical protein